VDKTPKAGNQSRDLGQHQVTSVLLSLKMDCFRPECTGTLVMDPLDPGHRADNEDPERGFMPLSHGLIVAPAVARQFSCCSCFVTRAPSQAMLNENSKHHVSLRPVFLLEI